MGTTWKVQINGGDVQDLETKTTQYGLAAFAALALLDYEQHPEYDVVKIWVPHLLPDYGPYFYAFDGHTTGRPDEHRKF